MLSYAVEVGFYSQVELLLEIKSWSPEDLDRALRKAGREGRVDLINLLLNQGACWKSIDLADVFGIMDDQLIKRFLKLGARFDDKDAFFTAMERKHARPLLRFYKEYRDAYPELEDQVAKSLVASVEHKKAHWTIMLLWAGADPQRDVAECGGPVEDVSYTTNAIKEAFLWDNAEFLSTTNICAKIKDHAKALRDVILSRNPETLKQIVKHLKPDQINQSESHSSENLEYIIHHEYCSYWCHDKQAEQNNMLSCIRLLIDAGAKWDPSDDSLRYARRGLSSYDERYIIQVIRLLVYTPGTAPFPKIWKLCNTPKMKHMIYKADDDLWREMNEMALEQGLKGATKRSSRVRVVR